MSPFCYSRYSHQKGFFLILITNIARNIFLNYCFNLVFFFRLFKAPDPCNSYKLLNNINRRVGYTVQSPLGCDQPGRGFTEGWYRFTGAAGVRMPTKCPAKRRCGTHAPGWLEGGHPTVAQGIASRKVCYHWSSGCCQWSNYIRVRNCGAFYVYELKRTPACSLRYCGEFKSLPKSFSDTSFFLPPNFDIIRNWSSASIARNSLDNSP